ncbi:MAG TPA: hypothetical protein VL068_04290 [Microthrixaceae bacterium]|nr:hypothetical protein [Microthrixaceae bacterium]
MSTTDEEMFRRYSQELADAIDSHVEGWVVSSVIRRCAAAGVELTPELEAALDSAARCCRAEVGTQMTALLTSDIDAQRTTPLAIIRSSIHYAADILARAGVGPVERDEFERRSFPDDIFGLSPASMSDVDESLAEPALVWGAAKAHIHRSRHS